MNKIKTIVFRLLPKMYIAISKKITYWKYNSLQYTQIAIPIRTIKKDFHKLQCLDIFKIKEENEWWFYKAIQYCFYVLF